MTTIQSTRRVPVIVDGNNHNLGVIVLMRITNNIVTIAQCRQIVERVRQLGGAVNHLAVNHLDVSLSVYEGDTGDYPTDRKSPIDTDGPVPCVLNKHVTYNVKADEMIVWRDGMPVYANTHGIICTDRDALADCLM